MAEEDIRYDLQQPASFSAWLGIVLLFIVFGLFVLIVIGAMPRGNDYETTRAKARREKLAELRKDADAALGSYGWANKQKGVARIPIERAMQLTMTELAGKKPTAAGPIATPQPAAPAPAAAPVAASPAPPAAGAAPTIPAPATSPKMRANPTPKPVSVQGSRPENNKQPAQSKPAPTP